MKNKGKKCWSILLALTMVFGLLPGAVAAEEAAVYVTNGYYDVDGMWNEEAPEGTGEYDISDTVQLKLDKTAEPTENPNEYTITLTVQLQAQETVVSVAAAAATVLIIDTSGSMEDSVPGGGPGASSQTRLQAAQQAARSFLTSYKGEEDVHGRYVAIVSFADLAHTVCSWVDITTEEGWNQAINAINGLHADGGTNLQQGLEKANSLFDSEIVAAIEKDLRNVIALTDGVPTYYGIQNSPFWGPRPEGGNGRNGSAVINQRTTATATALKGRIKSLYTVCFGAANDRCYAGGPTVGDFLKNNIASDADYAFNADDTSELNAAFSDITQTVVEEIETASGATVIDPMPPNIIPSVDVNDSDEYIWTLEDTEPEITETPNGRAYTYTYTTSYTVTIDADGQDFDEDAFYPANERTVLRFGDKEYEFPIPGIKGTTSRYSVTYQCGDHGKLTDGTDETDEITYDNVKKWSETVAETRPTPEVEAEPGWRFTGWSPEIADVVTGNAIYIAQYEEIPEWTVTFEMQGHGSDIDPQQVEDGEKAVRPEDPEEEGWSFMGWYTDEACETPFDFDTPITEDMDLYALWERTGNPFEDPTNPTEPVRPDPTPVLNTDDHYAYIIGYPDGTVRPEGTITRAETVTIFFRMLTDESRAAVWSTTNPFTDVKAADWFNNAISTMSNAGIVNGYPDGSFNPNGNITRAEFAAMAIRFFQDAKVGPSKFSDTIGHWAEEAINKAQAQGLITGYPDGTFRPDEPITRAEAMTIMNRVLKRAPHKDHLLSERYMITFTDNMDTTKWYYADVQEATNSHTYRMSGGYEEWEEILPIRDWAAFETMWSNANSAKNPGEVIGD